jgi:hypothetical protein
VRVELPGDEPAEAGLDSERAVLDDDGAAQDRTTGQPCTRQPSQGL